MLNYAQNRAIVVLLCVAVGLVWFDTSSHPQPAGYQKTAENIASNQNKNATEETKKEDSDAAIARYTFWLTVVTAILTAATIGLAIITIFQLGLARAEFVSTHRPRLRIRRTTLIEPVLPNSRCRIKMEVANVGETKATVVEFGIDVYGEGYPFDATPRPFNLVIEPGAQANLDIVGQILTEARIDAIQLETEELRVLGIINYRDDNMVLRTTSFARLYHRALSRFTKVPEDDPEADRDFED